MIKKIRHSLLFNLVTSCFLLFLTISPCSCLSQTNSSDSLATQATSSAHDCCDKGAKSNKGTKSDCDSCDSCVAITKDCTTNLSYFHSLAGSIHAPDMNVTNYFLSSFYSNNFNVPSVNIEAYFNPQTFLIKSSSSLSLLFNRWII